MGNVVAIQEKKPARKEPARKCSLHVEDPKAQYLLMGTDEKGKTVYFFKVQITGLRNRIFGPYATRSMAFECFDTVLNAALDSFCDAQNLAPPRMGTEHIVLPKDLTPIPARG